jgi:hypothetical protein
MDAFLSQLTLSEWKDIATIAGVAIALGTLINGLAEYTHQGAQKRAEHFLTMRKRLKESEVFEELCSLLETDDPRLSGLSFKDKRSLLGLFEEVALMMNSGLIREDVAHYMFGYYAIRCWESQNFWSDVNRDSIYWALFKDFVEKMKAIETSFSFRSRRYRF